MILSIEMKLYLFKIVDPQKGSVNKIILTKSQCKAKASVEDSIIFDMPPGFLSKDIIQKFL